MGAKRWIVGGLALAVALVAAKAWDDTMSMPDIRRLALHEEREGQSPARTTIAFLADIHVAGPDMPPARLARIVEQLNALAPDILVIAGDFTSDKRTATQRYSTPEALGPLAGLGSDTIKIAVPGNHDHWRGIEGIRAELAKHGFTVLQNDVAALGGVLFGGLDDDFTGRADVPLLLSRIGDVRGRTIVVSHSPDPFPDFPPGSAIMLAGHTHCGQIAYPWGGSPAHMSEYGEKYACGIVRERGNLLITTSGIGTSLLPFRFFTQPEIWMIEL